MRALIFTAGALTTALGFIAFQMIGDPALLQGALTLGGAWIIAGLFSYSSKWHGIGAAGVLALLGAARCATNLPDLVSRGAPSLPFQIAAFLISLTVLIAVVRALLAERARKQLADLMADSSPSEDSQ